MMDPVRTKRASRRVIRLGACLLLGAASRATAGFEPAFADDRVAYELCQEGRDGAMTPADPAKVRRVLGFHSADTNCEAATWQGGEAADGRETVFEYVVVLKESVAVGALCVDVADEEYNGSKNNGEVWLLRDGAALPPDPRRPEQWSRVDFPPCQPVARFAVLPTGTRSRAFLYRDVRVAGVSRVDHWRFFKHRLFNVTPEARGIASGGFKAGDPEGIPRGEAWTTEVGARGGPLGPKDPAWYILAWDQPRMIEALLLRSNIAGVEIHALTEAEGGPPGLAPESSWQKASLTAVQEDRHEFQHYAWLYRWLDLAPTRTRALRVRFGAVERGGKTAWINGIGVFEDLRGGAVPAPSVRDERVPFRIPYTLPCHGQAALVIEDAHGRRVRNLTALTERSAGAAEEGWDLRDDAGAVVAPGAYRLHGIVGPPIELLCRVTPYPNVDQLWPDRTPWLQGHSGPHGWLSDHCQNWAVASVGQRLYFGAPMAEAGVCLIECDLDGKKAWGKHDFGAWKGVGQMAGDERYLYVAASDNAVYRVDPEATNAATRIFEVFGRPERRGSFSCMAAHGGRVYLGFTGGAHLDNAFPAGMVDLDRCLPPPPAGDLLLRSLRLRGSPPGQGVNPADRRPKGNGQLDIESTVGRQPVQYTVIAFREPVPIGSLVFPNPGGFTQVEFSVLSPSAPYPPRPQEEKDWIPFEAKLRPGWTCVPAPPNTLTRALRITFAREDRRETDAVTDLLDEALAPTRAGGKAKDPLAGGNWFGRLEGLRFLRRRFVDLAPAARVRVNSGVVNPDGAWDAQRTKALGPEDPGIYVLEWPEPQKLAGLAIKEVDGAVTEVDVWQGPTPTPIPLEGPALDEKSAATGWRHVATYRQKRRSAYVPSAAMNKFARYLDDVVDFGGEIETRAVRLRVVAQWLDHGTKGAECRKHDGRSEHGMHYSRSYAAKLDTRLCRVEGAAALGALGGEPPVDALTYGRIDVRDGQTGALVNELPAQIGWHGLAFGPRGDLFAINRGHTAIVRVNLDTGATTPVVRDIQPSVMTAGPDGCFYVMPWTDNGTQPIQVYDGAGKLRRTIGEPGGQRAGAWDPQRFNQVHRLCVDRRGSLWVVEADNYPRRIVQYGPDGRLFKEIAGNTFYGGGGGGNLNRYDASRAWYGRVEFALDWTTHTSRIRGLVADDTDGTDFIALRLPGRRQTYLATAPLSLKARQPHGVVYLYDEAAGTARMAAAVGIAGDFAPLRASQAVSKLNGSVPSEFLFTWSDRDADGRVDAEEVEFTPRPKGFDGVGRFDYALGCVGPGILFAVREVLANGVPVYEQIPIPGAPHLRLASGNFLTLNGAQAGGAPLENFVTTPRGEKVWGYPASGGLSGLHLDRWQPGVVRNQFGVIGHEVPPNGEIGEFFVVHANTGEWNLWTADGLLAAQILLHKLNPRSKFFGPPESRPGTRLDPLSANQEHFHGFFTRTEPENRYFIIAGFTHMSVIEVRGIDCFRRFGVDVKVTPKDLARAQSWEKARVQRQIEGRALVLQARAMARTPTIDGTAAPDEWPTWTPVDAANTASFTMGYDPTRLYLCWKGKGIGPIRNSGAEFQRYFRTGAALDLQMGVDPAADPARQQPARGDLRLLVTFVNGEPQVVLYQPEAPDAAPGETWSTRTEAGGETAFARVARVRSAVVKMKGDKDFVVEASVPLNALGLRPTPGLRLKLDWGVLTSSDGNQVKERLYWANKTATGTGDEAVEARLEPAQWAVVEFTEDGE